MQNKKLILIFINLILIAMSSSVLILVFQNLPPQVPLLYSLPWGEGQLVNKMLLFALPVISFVFFIFNIFFVNFFKLKEDEENEKKIKFMKESLLFTSLVVAVINLITIVKVVRLFI